MCCTKRHFLCVCFPHLLHSRINNKILGIPVQTRDTFVKNIKLPKILLFSVFRTARAHCVYIEYLSQNIKQRRYNLLRFYLFSSPSHWYGMSQLLCKGYTDPVPLNFVGLKSLRCHPRRGPIETVFIADISIAKVNSVDMSLKKTSTCGSVCNAYCSKLFQS